MEKLLKVAESILSHPIFWGVVSAVALAIALSGKLSIPAAHGVLWAAYILALLGIYGALHLDPYFKLFVMLATAGILGIGTLAINRWFNSKERPNPPIATAMQPKKVITLKDLFQNDWPSFPGVYEVGLINSPQLRRPVRVEWRINGDFVARSRFLGIYFDGDVAPKDVAAALKLIAKQYKNYLSAADSTMDISTQIPGDSTPTRFRDLVFSDRIFVYYDNPGFTLAKQASLESLYKRNGLSIEFRGNTYLWLHKDDHPKLRDEPLGPGTMILPDIKSVPVGLEFSISSLK